MVSPEAGDHVAAPPDAREALSAGPSEEHARRDRQRVLRIRITEAETGHMKAGLTMPLGLVGVATRLGARFLPPGHSSLDLVGTIESGEFRSPMILLDEQNGERIEISIE